MKKITGTLFMSLLAMLLANGCGTANSGNDLSQGDTLVQDVAADAVVVNDIAGDAASDANPGDIAVETIVSDVETDTVTPAGIGMNPEVSECGGFVAAAKVPADESECGTDVLQWSVDPETGVISFVNAGVELNCCGIHSITVTREGDVFVITEIDEPESVDGRCFCTCLFDFAVDMPGVDTTSISVRIDRVISDQATPVTTAWEGEIDLTPGEGEVVIEENVGLCPVPVNIGLNPQFSGCGGFLPVRAAGATDCGDETLQWVVNSESATVTLVNSNIWLNCCGTHTMSIFDSDGVYTLAEVDEPENGVTRCKCMCLFDYSMELPGLFVGPVDIRITRFVSDSGDPTTVIWEGTIDLSAETGEVIIKTDVGYCG